jgi:hypothetical protein
MVLASPGPLHLLGSSVISDVDYLHLWTLRVVEKVMIQELATPESGGAMEVSIARPTLSKVRSMTGAEGR